MQVLVGVIVLLGLEAERHAQLGSNGREVALWRSIVEVVAAGHGLIAVHIVTIVIGGVFSRLNDHVLHTEGRIVGQRIAVVGEGAVEVCVLEAVLVGHEEAVGMPAARVVEIIRGDVVYRGLRHGDRVGVGAHGEGVLAVRLREMHAGEGGETDGVVLHGLGFGSVRPPDLERVAVAFGLDGERRYSHGCLCHRQGCDGQHCSKYLTDSVCFVHCFI